MRNPFRGLFGKLKQVGAQGIVGSVQTALRGRSTDPPLRGTGDFLATYSGSPFVRAVSGKVANDIAITKWTLSRSDTGAEVKSHIMLDTMRRPNNLMSGRGLMRVTQLSLDLVGDAFWLLERNGLGAPVRYWPIPAHWIQDTPTPERPTFRLSWMNAQGYIPEESMVWFQELDPFNPYLRGSGIVRAMADEVETDEYAAKHAKQLFWNRAMPEVVVTDADANEDELRRHERVWTQRLGGLFKALKPYFTNRKLEFWQPQQMNLENLTLVPLRKWERDIQLQCWGIPPEQLGIIEHSNRATAEASNFIYHDRLIRPRRELMAEELTLKLAKLYDPRLEVGFKDTTPRDKEYALNVAKVAPYSLTVDEWRELQGREPLPAGEGLMKYVPPNGYLTEDLTDTESRPASAGSTPQPEEEAPAEETPAEEPPAPKKKVATLGW